MASGSLLPASFLCWQMLSQCHAFFPEQQNLFCNMSNRLGWELPAPTARSTQSLGLCPCRGLELLSVLQSQQNRLSSS